MTGVWRIVLILTVALVTLGAVCAAIGLFTGGSVERIIDLLFGSRESFELTLRLLEEELTQLFASYGLGV